MFSRRSELLSISDSLGLFGCMMEGLVLTALSHNCAISKAGPGEKKWHHSTGSYELATTKLCYFFDYVSNEYFTSFHISVEELWIKSYGNHLEKSSFLKFQFCLLSQLFLIKTEESLEKFNFRRGIDKTNNTVHSQEWRQASLEIVDLNFHVLGELGPLFCAYMQS